VPAAGQDQSRVERYGGIDLGGTKIEAAVIDSSNRVLGSARRPTPTTGGPDGVAGAMAVVLGEACAAAGTEPSKLAGAGVGSPGIVDSDTGTVSSARNLPDWDGSYELGEVLSRRLGTRVSVGNDVQVATEGEFQLGAGRPYRSLLGVFWGTGVGGGIVLDGKPWVGRGGAGEIGHVVVRMGGARCPCGRRGCMEAYAGRGAMEARARRAVKRGARTQLFKLMEEHGRPRLTSGIWARALERQDQLAEELIERAIRALGAGVASAVNVLDVEAVVIGGGLGVRFGERYAERIREAMHPHLFNDAHPPDVKVAELGDLGGAIGASLLARRPPSATSSAAGGGADAESVQPG
jgi:glucokinase